MRKNGPIIVIDDDSDDLMLIREAFSNINLPNEIKLFDNGADAVSLLASGDVDPFMIVSDINMPRLNGFQYQEKIMEIAGFAEKRVPYIFLTTSSSAASRYVTGSGEGFFIKPNEFHVLENLLQTIVRYWTDFNIIA